MSSKSGSYVSTLTTDPTQRRILGVYQRVVHNKVKTGMAAEKISRHDTDALETTSVFLCHKPLPKSVIETVIRRIRHDDPQNYSAFIRYMADHYDEALALRSKLIPQQTYVSLCSVIAGLARYGGHDTFPPEHRSALLTAVYVLIVAKSADEELTYNHRDRYVRLTNGELLELIHEHSDNTARLREVMVRHLIVRPAEIEAAMAGSGGTLINGSL